VSGSVLTPKESHLQMEFWERTTGFWFGGGAIFGNPRRGSPDGSGTAGGTWSRKPCRVKKDRVDRLGVFEGDMKVTRAVQKVPKRTGSAAGSGSLEGQHFVPRPRRLRGEG
jgi:hypothetical protein